MPFPPPSSIIRPDQVGIEFALHQFPETATLNDVLSQIQILNEDNSVHGLLVQLPLPEHIDEALVIDAISPKKDVDG
jgi:5,10-methylene-tetrahydrofolate dehydrogenase/methenyl tetrahydrofolate cyclohydrolase